MKKKIILAMKKDLVDLDITANQLRIIEYMLKGKNWMKTKTALCKELLTRFILNQKKLHLLLNKEDEDDGIYRFN